MGKTIKKFPTSEHLKQSFEALEPEILDLFITTLKENIRTNKFGFPLSDSAIMSRVYDGGKIEVPLVSHGDYIESILIEGTSVTVRKGVHYSGLTFSELSNILELGRLDKGIHPVNVWERTYADLLPVFDTMIRESLDKLLT